MDFNTLSEHPLIDRLKEDGLAMNSAKVFNKPLPEGTFALEGLSDVMNRSGDNKQLMAF